MESNPRPGNRKQKRKLQRIKYRVGKRISGRPEKPAGDITYPGIIGKFTGRIALIFIVILLVITLFVGGTGLGIVAGYINTTEEIPNSLFKIKEQTSHMYDKDGTLIATLTGASNINREVVNYHEVSDTYIDEAFIAIEDRSFETNTGIDPKRIISAVISTLINLGESSHGGSTITQQTVKMITGDNEVSLQRKIQEWYRAVQLTNKLSKADIMHTYLNNVPMGNSYVGIESAAKAYFGKHASELNLPECALLAGIPKSPASFNVRTELGRKNALKRQRSVLQAMLEEDMITVQQFEDALNYELVFSHESLAQSTHSVNTYFEEHVMQEVTQDLMDQYGYTYNVANAMVMNGGLQIYTSLDPTIQEPLDRYFSDIDYFQADPFLFINTPEIPQGGMVVFDNRTGLLVAMQGGYGKKEANMVFNRATDSINSPASAIKPLGVYGPAIEEDIVTGATIIRDEEVYLDFQNPGVPWPDNWYTDEFLGDMSVRYAVKISNNIPSVKTLFQLGVDRSKAYMKKMGIDLTNDPVDLAIATGAFSYGVSPMQLGNAYQTFVNGGQYAPAKSYTKVVDADGIVLLENNPDYVSVFSPETSYMMLRIMESSLLPPSPGEIMLSSAYRIGPIHNANGEKITTSAKTGTGEKTISSWVELMTPYYSATAWYGFDNRIWTSYLEQSEKYNMHYLLRDYMNEIHQDLAPADWPQPAGIVALQVCSRSGLLASPGCGGYAYTEYFKIGSPITPTKQCPIHGGSGAPVNRLYNDTVWPNGKSYGH